MRWPRRRLTVFRRLLMIPVAAMRFHRERIWGPCFDNRRGDIRDIAHYVESRSVPDPEEDERGDQGERGPLIAGQRESEDRLGAQELGEEAVDEIGEDVELDELPAEPMAAEE